MQADAALPSLPCTLTLEPEAGGVIALPTVY